MIQLILFLVLIPVSKDASRSYLKYKGQYELSRNKEFYSKREYRILGIQKPLEYTLDPPKDHLTENLG